MTLKALLCRIEFERQYGVRKTKFYELLKTGELRAVKVGRRTFVTREAAEEWARKLKPYPVKGE